MMRSIFGLLISPLFVLFVVWPEAWAQLNDFDRQEFTFENGFAKLNPGCESGTAKYTASGGLLTANTGTQIVPNSKTFCEWDSNAASQTVSSELGSVPKTGNCEVGVWVAVPSGTATHTIHASDGTNNLTQPRQITGTADAFFERVNFPCPSNGQAKWVITSVNANEPKISWDNTRGGRATNVGTVAQAVFKGSVLMTGCTDWTRSNGTFDNFAATSGCTYTVDGDVLAPSTVIPGFRLQNVAPGRYLIIARGFFGKNISTTNADVSFRFYDGTTTFSEQVAVAAASSSGQSIGVGEITGSIGYTTAQSTLTIQVQGKVSSTASSTAALIRDDGGSNTGTQINGLSFEVYHFPTSAQTAVMPDAQGWFAAGNISGANPDLGLVAVSSYTEITNSSLTLTPKSGSAPIGIMCSGTNAAAAPSTSATTCSAGNESVGFNVNVPRSGAYEMCFDFSHNMTVNAGNTGIATFQVVRTATNAQTILEEGGGRTHSGNTGGSTAGTGDVAFMSRTACGVFNLSAGVNGFRLMYEQAIGGAGPAGSAVVADGDSTVGQRDIFFRMKPVTSQQQAILANSVSTPRQSGDKQCHMYVQNSGTPTVLRSNGCVPTGTSTITDHAAGETTVTWGSGVFSAIPDSCSGNVIGGNQVVRIQSLTQTSVRIHTPVTTTGTNADADFTLSCSGPR